MLTGRLAVRLLRPVRQTSPRRLYAPTGPTQAVLAPRGDRVSIVAAERPDTVYLVEPGLRARRRITTFPGPIAAHSWGPSGDWLAAIAPARPGGPARLHLVDLRDACTIDATPCHSAGEPTLVDPTVARRHGAIVRSRTDTSGEVLHLIAPSAEPRALGPPLDAELWYLDLEDRLRAAASWDKDGHLVILRLDPSTGWTPAYRLAPPTGLLTHPQDLSADGSRLLLHGPLTGQYLALGELDLARGTVGSLVCDAERDIETVMVDPLERTPLHAWAAGPRPVPRVLDPRAVGLGAVAAALGGDIRPESASRDGTCWLLRVGAADLPDQLVHWNRGSGHWHRIDLPTARSPRRAARTFTARFAATDSLDLDLYLTLPRTTRPGPAVVLVHGGPWARDDWVYSPDVQWLAGLGYAVIQVQFRGSEGRGADFLGMADGDWGGRTQQDLVDAARWAVDRGYADPTRLVIMGSSYGGYAAMAAATIGPAVFAAAVAVSGAADLVALSASFDRQTFLHALFRHRLGDPGRDRERLRAQSPLTHVADVHTPLLLVHGRLDPVFPVDQSRSMAAALAAAGAPHEYLELPDEGHGVHAAANRVAVARHVERFLRRHVERRHTRTRPDAKPLLRRTGAAR